MGLLAEGKILLSSIASRGFYEPSRKNTQRELAESYLMIQVLSVFRFHYCRHFSAIL